MNPNGLQKQCRYYDTSIEFNKTVDYVNNISILHTNICSSINKLNDFMYYIDNLDTTFHFIGLSETWATDNNKDLLIFESIFIEVDKSIFSINRNVIRCEIYNPPSSKLKYFNTNLEKILLKIKNEKKFAFIMADFNVNTLIEIKSSTSQMQDFSNIFATFYYHKLINLPTRERKQSATLLDNIYTNIPDCYETGTSGILKFLTQSDHYPIFTIRKSKTVLKPIEYI